MSKIIQFPKNEPKRIWVQAKGPKEAEIWIYEDIGMGWFDEGLTAKQFAKDITALGDIDKITATKRSITGKYLRGDEEIEIPKQRRVVIAKTSKRPKVKKPISPKPRKVETSTRRCRSISTF